MFGIIEGFVGNHYINKSCGAKFHFAFSYLHTLAMKLYFQTCDNCMKSVSLLIVPKQIHIL